MLHHLRAIVEKGQIFSFGIMIQEFKVIQVTSNHEATQICKLERKIDSKVVFNIHFLFIQMSNLKLLLKTAATHSHNRTLKH